MTAAVANYTILTVGDGLVSQIPALIISTAAGLLVSRSASDDRMGKEFGKHIFTNPNPIYIGSFVVFLFGLVPGLPAFPFMTLAGILGGCVYLFQKQQTLRSDRPQTGAEAEEAPEDTSPEEVEHLLALDTMELEVGYGLIPLVDIEQEGQLLERIKSIRRQVAHDIGIVVAPIHIQDNMQLKSGEYTILLKGNEIARGDLMTNYHLAMNPGASEEKIEGIPTREPTYGLPALWIKETAKEDALSKGYTVVDLTTVMITHLSDVIKRHSHELLGRQEVQQLLDSLKETHPKVVEELIPNLLPLGGVVRVLQNLLKEQIPIRDLLAIMETLADWAPVTKDLDLLTDKTRQSLARTITKLHLTSEGIIPAVTLSPAVESVLSEAIQQAEHGGVLALDPAIAQKIINNLAAQLENAAALNYQPLVICSAPIRSQFKKLVERFIPNITIISYDEILNSTEIKSLGTVELSDAD